MSTQLASVAGTSQYTLFKIGDLVHIEWTALLFTFVVFCLTAYLVNRFLFRPILTLNEIREKEITEAMDSISEINAVLDAAKTELKEKNDTKMSEIKSQQERLRGEGTKMHWDIINKAKKSAEAEIQGFSKEINDQFIAFIESENMNKAKADVKQTILSAIR